MKRHRRLPLPDLALDDTGFRLVGQTTGDGERTRREADQKADDRKASEARQTGLFDSPAPET